MLVMARARPWLLLVAGTIGSVLVSYFVWWFWGMGLCGEEAYDSPPGSTGDALCQALVQPVWPLALLAATPTMLALGGGLLGLIFRLPRLFVFSLVAPMVIGVLTFFLAPALL